jgi:ABC-type transporter Mla maintaining outer membrane lipid asymmetry ATPase subunit MlaF
LIEPGTGDVLIELRNVRKDYGGLRPLRINQLDLRQGQTLALVGFDRITAEVFVNLVTGATVPDAGDVRVLGQSTAAIADPDAWLASLDRFGILSERAVLLEALTVAQNLAVPLTLELEPLADPIRAQVARLAGEVGLDPSDLPRPVSAITPAGRQRVRLARAVALNPLVLLSEHPNAALAPQDAAAFADALAAVTAHRGLASIVLTADRAFASATAREVRTLNPATGDLAALSGWRRLFAR